MGFLSKAWKGVKKAVKTIGDKTGIDDIITKLPGTKEQAATVAKIAALAAGAYYAAPYIGSLMASSGTAAAGTAAGTAAAGTAAGTTTAASLGSVLGTAGGMESVIATAPAWGGLTAGEAALAAGGAGAVGSLYNSGSLFNSGSVGDGAVGAGADGSIGTLYGANSGLSSYGMTPEAMSALQGTSSSTGASSFDWAKNLSNLGNNLGGAVGSYLGGQQQAQGYEDAGKLLEQLGQKADYASQLSDPFQKYRSSYAQQLDDTMQGRRSITTDPGYQFQYNEGQQAVERAASARGMGTSGNMMTALQQRGQDVASQQYGTIIDRLTNLAGAGSQNAQAGGQIYGNMTGTALQGQASAALGQNMSQAAGTSGLIGGLGSAIGSYYGGGGTTAGAISSVKNFFS